MPKPLSEPYPPRDMPWQRTEQPYGYPSEGESGDNSGGLLPPTPDPEEGVPLQQPSDNDEDD